MVIGGTRLPSCWMILPCSFDAYAKSDLRVLRWLQARGNRYLQSLGHLVHSFRKDIIILLIPNGCSLDTRVYFQSVYASSLYGVFRLNIISKDMRLKACSNGLVLCPNRNRTKRGSSN